MKCFSCELDRACKSCLDLVSQKMTYATDINLLKRQLPKEKHQMLPCNIGEYKPKTSIFYFEAAKEVLLLLKKQWMKIDVSRDLKIW